MMAKKNDFQIKIVRDKIVHSEPERYVRLRITLNGVTETIVCPYDFDELIDSLDTCSVGAEAVQIYGDHKDQMENLGLIRRNARLSWYPTKLLHKHAQALKEAFRCRLNKIDEMIVDD